MNGELPPIDPKIRAHLARRSAGGLPRGLLGDVAQALDSVAMERPRPRRIGGRVTWRSPQLAAAASIAVIAVVAAALVAIPRLATTPASSLAGYPADRALTTTELASLMAGPELAPNTTLVAAVTIESRQDVCPMNSRPTVGVVEGMGSQVCVMGATLAAELPGATTSGVFAFRYMARGYLGLLGQISPATSRLAFHVTDDWPLAGKTFLVEGWLGETPAICALLVPSPFSGDPLDPSGDEPCAYSWLSENGSPVPAPATWTPASGSPEAAAHAASSTPTADPLTLIGKARYVEAGGARQIDSIPQEPTRGVYVVRSVVGPCPGASPVDSRGCGIWRVLARVGDVKIPGPNESATIAAPTATPTTAPPETPVALPSALLDPAPVGFIGPGNRPLTAAEFQAAWAADRENLAGRIAIVKGPVPAGFVCSSADATTTTPACNVAKLDGFIAQEGYWGVRVGSDGRLTMLGELSLTRDGGFVFLPEDVIADTGLAPNDLLIVSGELNVRTTETCVATDPNCSPPTDLHDTSAVLDAGPGAYGAVTGEDYGNPVTGLFLIRRGTDSVEILACFEFSYL